MTDIVKVLCGSSCRRRLMSVRPAGLGQIEVETVPRRRSHDDTGTTRQEPTPQVVVYPVEAMIDEHLWLECDRHGQRLIDGNDLINAVRQFAHRNKPQTIESSPAPGGGRTKHSPLRTGRDIAL